MRSKEEIAEVKAMAEAYPDPNEELLKPESRWRKVTNGEALPIATIVRITNIIGGCVYFVAEGSPAMGHTWSTANFLTHFVPCVPKKEEKKPVEALPWKEGDTVYLRAKVGPTKDGKTEVLPEGMAVWLPWETEHVLAAEDLPDASRLRGELEATKALVDRYIKANTSHPGTPRDTRYMQMQLADVKTKRDDFYSRWQGAVADCDAAMREVTRLRARLKTVEDMLYRRERKS
jgi:hypothetical protein